MPRNDTVAVHASGRFGVKRLDVTNGVQVAVTTQNAGGVWVGELTHVLKVLPEGWSEFSSDSIQNSEDVYGLWVVLVGTPFFRFGPMHYARQMLVEIWKRGRGIRLERLSYAQSEVIGKAPSFKHRARQEKTRREGARVYFADVRRR